MISKRGTVTIAIDGTITVDGYELSELTWVQDPWRSALYQALDEAYYTIHVKKAELEQQIDVKDAPVPVKIEAVAVIAKGKAIVKPIAVVAEIG